ncbi:hypothetical protein K431DRAFT_265429 [Polychaeton citri CBS 116435]|uniref:Uncharacterized protein n=1 Tax=Polychaeton citri CBS 116435 TaxID=1314669 RepID=A0A9P4URR9_9PEZI|nr:hypothetical protein K431DRAFT_265429 [Polychaeton citri CBS 116435]
MPDIQGVRSRRSNYGDAFNDAIESHHAFGSCIWGAIEMLTFHPLGTQQPLAGLRLARNGWTENDIAKAQLYARDRHSQVNVHQKFGALKHELNKNGRIVFRDPNFTARRYRDQQLLVPTADYSSASYRPRHQYDFDPKTFQPVTADASRSRGGGYSAAQQNLPSLVRMAVGVANWPQGQDAGIVTQAIRWAVEHQNCSLSVHDIPILAQRQGFVAPAESSTMGWDQNARNRIVPVVDASDKYTVP